MAWGAALAAGVIAAAVVVVSPEIARHFDFRLR
jgi:hypothetical protein